MVAAIKEKEMLQTTLRETTEAIEKIDIFLNAHKGLPPSMAATISAQIAPLIRQREELELKLKPAMQRLSQLEQFLVTYRSLVGRSPDIVAPIPERASLGRGGMGMAQPLFVRLAVMVLRDMKRPMQSGEFVDEFRKRGHEIGGENETKTAWNRLWQAKRDGHLVHHAALGYWLPNEPLPEGAEEKALAARAERRIENRGKGRGRPKSKRRGARKLLTDAQIKIAEQWLASGKPVAEVCAELGGISAGTLWNNIPGRIRGARERYPELAAQAAARAKPPRPYRVRKPSDKRLGRPPTISGEKAEMAESMFLSGATMKEIASAVGVNLTSVYRYFGMKNRTYWEKRRAEAQKTSK
ncbi:MAG TPA: hypothetical protein VH744_08065 [Terriglobales bacterium]